MLFTVLPTRSTPSRSDDSINGTRVVLACRSCLGRERNRSLNRIETITLTLTLDPKVKGQRRKDPTWSLPPPSPLPAHSTGKVLLSLGRPHHRAVSPWTRTKGADTEPLDGGALTRGWTRAPTRGPAAVPSPASPGRHGVQLPLDLACAGAREEWKSQEKKEGRREQQAAAVCRAAPPFTVAGHRQPLARPNLSSPLREAGVRSEGGEDEMG
jgi:hypothetical protein